MTLEDTVRQFKDKADSFHATYTQHLSINLSVSDEFNKLRLFYLNILTDDLEEFFDSARKRQRVISLKQVGFNIWANISDKVLFRNEMYVFFFMAACFIAIKLESKTMVKKLRSWACYHCIDLDFILNAERLILNKAGWDLELVTSEDCAEVIHKEFLVKDLETSATETISGTSCTWREFALYEYCIYQKYDIVTISFASYYIELSLMCESELEGNGHSTNLLLERYESFIESTHVLSCQSIRQCALDIHSQFQSNEAEESDSFEVKSKSTRSNSQSSFTLLFALNENADVALENAGLEQDLTIDEDTIRSSYRF